MRKSTFLITLLLILLGWPVDAAQTTQDSQDAKPTITFTSDPPGADIELNGSIVGKTPLMVSASLIGAEYTIVIKKEGYAPWTKRTVSVAGHTVINAALVPIKVDVKPVGTAPGDIEDPATKPAKPLSAPPPDKSQVGIPAVPRSTQPTKTAVEGPPVAPTTTSAPPSRRGKSTKLHGYVTEVYSQNSFEIDDYRINREASLTLEFEKEDQDETDSEPLTDIRVGTELEIKGEYDPGSHELHARSIKVFPSELRKVKRTALLENMPEIQNKGEYWEGSMRVDGQQLLVDEQTKLSIVPNKSQRKAIKESAKAASKAAKAGEPLATDGVALTRLNEVHRNMFVSYEGRRDPDGKIRALKIEFKDNELTPAEAKLWKSITPKVKAFKSEKPGELKIPRVGRFKTVPNEEVQQYVRRLGESLIPANQKELPPGDPGRIPFQFFVIEEKSFNAFALANGTVVVHSGLFRSIENEAQLAFILGHEISHATQEHTLRQMEFHKKKRMLLTIGAAVAAGYGAYNVRDILNLASAAIANGYTRYLENQADRLGMEYMLGAGYDPREAPRSWKALSLKYGDAPTNFFWSSHDNNMTRRSYLMAELRNSYRGVDFSAKKRNDDEFRRTAEFFQSRDKSAKKVKVKY